MAADLHPLLRRQLRRLGLDETGPGPGPALWPQLLERVSRAYADADQERYRLERSQELATRETGALHAQLQTSQARLAHLVALSADLVWEQDAEGRFTYVSEDITRLGLSTAGVLGQRRRLDDLPPLTGNCPQALQALVAAQQPFRNFTYGLRRPDGQALYVRISGDPVFEQGVFVGYRGVACDVTQATLDELRVQQLAHYDTLTGLANRAMFLDGLDRLLARAAQAGSSFALLFIDLDHFKAVNDTLGHDAGDALLRVVAARLGGLLRDVDMVARLGGDEFVVLIAGSPDPAALSKVASRLLTALAEPLVLCGRSVQVSASVGISLYPTDGADAATLMKHADVAMYQAKAQGKNNFQFFTPALARRAAHFFALEADLREAVERGQLLLRYLPRVDAGGPALAGLVAQLHWRHPQHGLLAPEDFMPLAEESGLSVPIGRWLLQAVCQQLRAWREAGFDPPRCTVPLTASQLGAGLADTLRDALGASALESGMLEMAVPESLLRSERLPVRSALQALAGAGVRLAIDDFGGGGAALAGLQRQGAQSLTLGRALVAGLPGQPRDVALARAVIDVARSLQMDVVADGVDTPEQQALLRSLGCAAVQGALAGAAAEAEALVPRFKTFEPLRLAV